MTRLTEETHERIIFWSKVGMFAIFTANLFRIMYKIWRYGGNKKREVVEFDNGDDDIPPIEGIPMEDEK